MWFVDDARAAAGVLSVRHHKKPTFLRYKHPVDQRYRKGGIAMPDIFLQKQAEQEVRERPGRLVAGSSGSPSDMPAEQVFCCFFAAGSANGVGRRRKGPAPASALRLGDGQADLLALGQSERVPSGSANKALSWVGGPRSSAALRSRPSRVPMRRSQPGTRFGVVSNGSPGWPVNRSPSACISRACFLTVGRMETILSKSRSAAIPG
jgi:hypothetical protein